MRQKITGNYTTGTRGLEAQKAIVKQPAFPAKQDLVNEYLVIG
jgi:hypothetical protein